MFKKLFIGLAPLLAIAAFAMMPVAAQAATQHWYKERVRLPEGESAPIVTVGNKVNVSQNSALGEINCRGVGGGIIENPVGGGAGVGRTNSSTFYECKAPLCEAEIMTKVGLPGRATITTQNNPAATKEPAVPGWSNVLEESTVAGVSSVREKIGEPFVTFKTPSPPGMIRETADCLIAPTGQVAVEAIFEGELKPEIGVTKTGNLNGKSATRPSQVNFSGASTGALHSQVAGELTLTGNLKFVGYNELELITVKP
jgi:hypothetical protein